MRRERIRTQGGGIPIKEKTLSRTRAEILLALVILARSSSFVFTKIGMRDLGAFTLLGLRFLAAFLILLPLGWRRLARASGKTVLRGLLLGIAFFAMMAAEVSGLRTASASSAAFLENTAIALVPLFGAALTRRLPRLPAVVSTALCLAGVALLTLRGGTLTLSAGEWLCLLAAVFYAAAILLTDRISRKDDPFTLGILQVGFMGAFSAAAAFLFETPALPAAPAEWGVVLTLAVVCTCFGFTLQPLAQSGTTAERAGLFCALSPAGAAILGSAFLRERLAPAGIAGMGLILLGMLAANLPGVKSRRGLTRGPGFGL